MSSHISSLLSTLSACVYGVSLILPPPFTSSLPISTSPSLTAIFIFGANGFRTVHDHTRALTSTLGLLHPLGGGRQALDAIVVLDSQFRRRMLLPLGWGPTSRSEDDVDEVVGGDGQREVQRVIREVVEGVEWLVHDEVERAEREWREGMRMA